jgi:hypothetical protein
MIIYGHRKREKDIAEGEFSCPRCQARRPFKYKQMGRYLTLFFIPLFRLARLGEYVECQVCLTTFTSDVLLLPGRGTTSLPGQGQPATLRPPRSQERQGWVFAGLGVLGVILGGLVGLFATFVQFTSSAGPADNWQGFIGVLILCPLPLVVTGTGLLGWGLYNVWRVRQSRQKAA